MRFSKWSFRNADVILETKPERQTEIEGVLERLPEKHPVDNLHNLVCKGLSNAGWSKSKEISRHLPKKQTFDSFDDRIGVEVEFSRYEIVYRDYFRFLLAYNLDKIDLGILVVFTEETKKKYKDPNVAPSFEYCVSELESLKHLVGVPILVIGLE